MKLTKKIALTLILALTISLFAVPFSSSARMSFYPSRGTVSEKVEENHDNLLYAMVDSANYTIDFLVRIAQWTPYNDVDYLLAAVEAVVAPVFAYADAIGAEIVCEYVAYEIDGQTVMIDPIRVINIGGNS